MEYYQVATIVHFDTLSNELTSRFENFKKYVGYICYFFGNYLLTLSIRITECSVIEESATDIIMHVV